MRNNKQEKIKFTLKMPSAEIAWVWGTQQVLSIYKVN